MNQITVLQNTGPTTIAQRWYEDGTQVDAGQVVTLAIESVSGEEILAETNAQRDLEGTENDLVFYWHDLAIQDTLDELIATWTRPDTGASLRSRIDVVGGHLFTVAEALAFKDRVGAGIPVATVVALRDDIETFFQDTCRRAFFPRYGREVLTFGSNNRAWTHNPDLITVRSITVNGTAQSLTLLDTEPDGRLYLPGLWGKATVEYEYGLVRVPPNVRRAALAYLMHLVAGSDLLDRAIVHTDDTGTYRLQQPGMNHPTGIPEVDAALESWTHVWGAA